MRRFKNTFQTIVDELFAAHYQKEFFYLTFQIASSQSPESKPAAEPTHQRSKPPRRYKILSNCDDPATKSFSHLVLG